MKSNDKKIAVVGIACRFPGADNIEEFWKNLMDGKDTITRFKDEELEPYEYEYESLRNNPEFVKAHGILKDVDKFDASFFGYTPKEASNLDPQYRVWLETVWGALENAGYDSLNYKGKIGVFAGGGINTYLLNNVLRDAKSLEYYIRMRSPESFQTMIGNEVSCLPTKTAYKLNLKGPAINVQTACSTSLVAVAMACYNLLNGESDMCIAGGVSIMVPQEMGYLYHEGGIPSPDGYCRSFDSEAKGTVFSNGLGAVVLKKLDAAIRDKDIIYSVITGWALNNDGSSKVSYVAPSIDGQADVIQMAQSLAGISPEDIGYIEAHGTGTLLGDPIELTALLNAFSAGTDKKQYCGIGSVKSNIGHSDVAAGIAGFIKASLAAYYKIIPPTIHFKEPNPYFDFEKSPFYVQDKPKKWIEDKPLMIGVSSFGIGGTNVHVILEEPPVAPEPDFSPSEWPELLVISAKSEKALQEKEKDLIEFAIKRSEMALRDVAFTLGTGRNHMKYRGFAVASSMQELVSTPAPFTRGKSDDFISKIAFIFPGQGAQYLSMGQGLYASSSLFRKLLDECFEIAKSETGEDWKVILFSSANDKDAETRLAQTAYTQPALFMIEYALAKTLMQLGIMPSYLIGHSIGEYTAACISGVFDVNTAMKVVLKRGALMQKMPRGAMLAARASVDILKSIKGQFFEIAADNSDTFCTISFKMDQGDTVKRLLEENSIQYLPLNTSHAFHSSDFDPILDEFADYVGQFQLNEPTIPFISCLTGDFITTQQATSGAYWAKQLRNTVLFRNGIGSIMGVDDVAFLEVGPNTHLSALVKSNEAVTQKKAVISTLGKPDKTAESYRIMAAIGNLFTCGIAIDFERFQTGFKPRKISLPTYPFEKTRCWIDFKLSDAKPGHLSTGITVPTNQTSGKEITTVDEVAQSLTTGDRTANKVLQIWKNLFGIDEIGLDDDFFEMGGHSLLALQILTRVKEELNQNISLRVFIENPTVNKLCSVISGREETVPAEMKHLHLTDLSQLPLSDNQKRLWIVSRLDKFNPAYNIPFTYHLKGNLDIEVFRESINTLFRRHHIVFSTFKEIDGIPYSSINPTDVNIEIIDFSSYPKDERMIITNEFIGSDARKYFDLEKGPLYRVYLLKHGETEYYFHVNIHHIVFDGWSWGVFIHDFNAIYNGLISNEEIKLDALPYQYYDYAQWFDDSMSKANEEKLTKFWVDYLKDIPSVLNFPFDQVRTNESKGFGEKEYIRIPEEITNQLKIISKKENSTLFTVLLSAFGLLLGNYSGDDDICIGTPVANRPNSNLENVFGMFVNTIAIRIKIANIDSFLHLLKQVKNSVIDAISHQELPFEKIVEAINPTRTFNMNPLFQACFAWQNNLSIPIDLKNLKGERVTFGDGIAPFDLTLYMWENGDFIEGEIEFNNSLIKRETAVRLKHNFLTLLSNLIQNTEAPIHSIQMIAEEDIHKITLFNKTATIYPREKSIAQLFEEQVSLYPDKQAIVFKEKQYTYKQLDAKANQLAWTLRNQGVRDNQTVGILADKSLGMIVGILGILKAGGCYVPIDPDYPLQRITFILNDSRCKILLAQGKYEKIAVNGIKLINIDSNQAYFSREDKPELNYSSSDLAYVMYTSGTTGTPKGSAIFQRGVVRLVRNTNYIEIKPTDRILLTGAIVFDASTFEIWGALLNGGTLFIADKETIMSPKDLGNQLSQNRITILWLTSPLFTHIAESRTDIFSNLTYLLVGGDVLSPQHINKVRRENPALKVINGYGPTENTTFSTTFLIEKEYMTNIPIGKPISNSTAYIFDKNRNYAPIGVIGELFVGGDGLTMGYLNRDDLNTTSFITNPYNQAERLYKTGDKARWLADGNIEFHGRIDNQLKIRGFRVELQEIESVLSEMEGVIEAIVLPTKIDGSLQLAAFLNAQPGYYTDVKSLFKLVREKLPSYMVPAIMHVMNGFPTNINGKIDRGALEDLLKEVEVSKSIEQTDNMTQVEKTIFDIWCEALKTRNISITDNFFDLGGNSMIAIAIMSKLENVFNLEISLRVFFDSPCIKDLAEAIDIAKYTQSKVKSEAENQPQKRVIRGEV